MKRYHWEGRLHDADKRINELESQLKSALKKAWSLIRKSPTNILDLPRDVRDIGFILRYLRNIDAVLAAHIDHLQQQLDFARSQKAQALTNLENTVRAQIAADLYLLNLEQQLAKAQEE